jgi:hypothetical protein
MLISENYIRIEKKILLLTIAFNVVLLIFQYLMMSKLGFIGFRNSIFARIEFFVVFSLLLVILYLITISLSQYLIYILKSKFDIKRLMYNEYFITILYGLITVIFFTPWLISSTEIDGDNFSVLKEMEFIIVLNIATTQFMFIRYKILSRFSNNI